MRAPVLVLLMLALGLAACGDEDGDTTDAATTEPAPAQTEAPPPPPAPAGEKPEIAKPKGDPPTKLVIKDLKEGTGAEAKAGDILTMQYVGVAWSTGEQFDASWDRGQPFVFPLGQGQVIQGWDEGIVGMKEGGRRRLEIPSELAYGAQGAPPAIGPDEALVFVVDLEKVESG